MRLQHVANSTFPNNSYSPATPYKLLNMPLITRPVSIELVEPELSPSGWNHSVIAALMVVPKTTMYEYYGVPFRQDNVRFSRHVFDM